MLGRYIGSHVVDNSLYEWVFKDLDLGTEDCDSLIRKWYNWAVAQTNRCFRCDWCLSHSHQFIGIFSPLIWSHLISSIYFLSFSHPPALPPSLPCLGNNKLPVSIKPFILYKMSGIISWEKSGWSHLSSSHVCKVICNFMLGKRNYG